MEKNKFGIYIHWPFCASKCPYCDFNSHVKKNDDDYIKAYLKELEYYHNLTSSQKVTSIFFGGGTPSLMKESEVSSLINFISKHWQIADDVEISLEANPTSVETEKFAEFKNAGINRLSLGVQSLDNNNLKFLGRNHSAGEALVALDKVQNIFDNSSLDLIYALPNQSLSDWEKELKKALSFGLKHLSLYQLTIEEGTIFYKQAKLGKLTEIDEKIASQMYNLTDDVCASFGINKYEVSNYAKEGFESSHNLIYWQGYDYLGIGAGAHGRINKFMGTSNYKNPQKWHDKVIENNHGAEEIETLNQEERAEELILMGLRTAEGINKERFKSICGLDLLDVVDTGSLEGFCEEGLLVDDEDNLKATKHGFLVLNHIIRWII